MMRILCRWFDARKADLINKDLDIQEYTFRCIIVLSVGMPEKSLVLVETPLKQSLVVNFFDFLHDFGFWLQCTLELAQHRRMHPIAAFVMPMMFCRGALSSLRSMRTGMQAQAQSGFRCSTKFPRRSQRSMRMVAVRDDPAEHAAPLTKERRRVERSHLYQLMQPHLTGKPYGKYLRQVVRDEFVIARDQEDSETCYAHAIASAVHHAALRVVGRDGPQPEFTQIRDDIIRRFDRKASRPTSRVLNYACKKYNLRRELVSYQEACAAAQAGRPVVATFDLSEQGWDKFQDFFKRKPRGVLCAKDIRNVCDDHVEGHVVLLVRVNENYMTFMNSWGPAFADAGFFKVAGPWVLSDINKMEFFDVFWYESDLSAEEQSRYRRLLKQS